MSLDEDKTNLDLTDEISSDLLDSLDMENLENKDEELSRSLLNQMLSAPEKKVSLPVDTLDEIRIPENIEQAQQEGFVYYTAMAYYKELVKRAKRYNKMYCKINKRTLRAWRTLKNPDAGQKYGKEFNPFVCHLALEAYDSTVDLSKREIVTDAATSDEATLQAAYKLGFLDSVDFKSAELRFYPITMDKIKNDPKYMAAVRKQEELTEQSKQINQATYASKFHRETWAADLIKKIEEADMKEKGAM